MVFINYQYQIIQIISYYLIIKMNEKIGKIYLVAGLHYGDEGKGTTVDYLVKQKAAQLVVRYGGGPQAAHHVVLDNNKWHCFSHFGSGMFTQNCNTVISKYMVIYPQTLQRQTQILSSKGVKNLVKRLKIDLQCFVVTPYHQLVSRVFQILRQKKRGSTGIGVGITVQEAYGATKDHFPKSELYPGSKWTFMKVKDLLDQKICQQKIKKIFEEKTGLISNLLKMKNDELLQNLYNEEQILVHKIKQDIGFDKKKLVLQQLVNFTSKESFNNINNCISFYSKFRNQYKNCFTNTNQIIKSSLLAGKNVVFEGSQGALLDPIYGIYPHITKTMCTDINAIQIISHLKIQVQLIKIGVLRCYSHRHGAGPFISEKQYWNNMLPQLHNKTSNWQGDFRVGPFDVVIAKYGIQIFNPDYIVITCLDRLYQIQQSNQICTAYKILKKNIDQELQKIIKQISTYEQTENEIIIRQLRKLSEEQMFKSHKLLKVLLKCEPIYEKIKSEGTIKLKFHSKLKKSSTQINSLLNYLQKEFKKQIAFISTSPTSSGKIKLFQI